MQSQIDTLKTELQKQKGKAAAASAAGLSPSDLDAQGDDADDLVVYDFTIEQLHEHRKMYLLQGIGEGHPLLVQLGIQIKTQQSAKMADQPGSVRVAQADKSSRQCKAAVTAIAGKREKARVDMAELLKHDASLACQAAAAQQSLLEAERAKTTLLVELQASGGVGATVGEGRPYAVLTNSVEASSDELWASLGLSAVPRTYVVDILRKLGGLAQPAGSGAPPAGASGPSVPLSTAEAQPPAAERVDASSATALHADALARDGAATPPSTVLGDGAGLPAVVIDDDSELEDVFMGILGAHHMLDGHCDVAQQRQLAALLVTRVEGGKRRLVQQEQGFD
jgi:hypothetical protein